MIASIRRRRDFEYLRRSGTRIRPDLPVSVVNRSLVNRSLWCNYAPAPVASLAEAPDPDSASEHRVAFAIGRPVGGAVVRNRLRRRLRACLVDEAAAGTLPPGWFLFGATPSAATLDAAGIRAGVRSIAARAAEVATAGGRS